MKVVQTLTITASFLFASITCGQQTDSPSNNGNVAKGFWQRLGRAYKDDWRPPVPSGDPAPAADPATAFRGYPAPQENPPYPFTVWPIGGTVNIGQPFTISTPLMTAIYGGESADAWKKSRIAIYGWASVGMNLSTSSDTSGGKYANAPAAYAQVPNSVQLDQATLYIERQPDTVQKEHFDWGFRLTNLYGTDYRFTTAKGIFSQQLLNSPQPDGTIGKKYGYDPVMYYIDLYFPQVAEGLNVRMGRYISLPDIEAQLAPNNYTFTHSLTYTYDCYTQTGITGTLKLSNHWTVQAGFSGGCDVAPWPNDARPTGTFCAGYTWSNGGDNVYVCANSVNDGKYAYNNLAAYNATWYHKFNSKWHTATEFWYQYEKQVPNVRNPDAQSLLQTNANGAVCNRAADLTCFAPEYSAVNYTSRQFGKKDFLSFRNEFLNDERGHRSGYRTLYEENGGSWNHWLGSTLVLRPELRYEHAFDAPACQNGTRKSQFMFAGDVIWFF
jgi:hypothetical protein